MLLKFVFHYDLSLSIRAKDSPTVGSREEAIANDHTYILKLGVLPLKRALAGRRDILIGVLVKGTKLLSMQTEASLGQVAPGGPRVVADQSPAGCSREPSRAGVAATPRGR